MILAAGRGERMGKLTQKNPKPLTKIGNITLLEHNLKRFKNAGINDIVINVSWLGQQIINYLDKLDMGLNITILNESDNMLGTGGGIKNALNILGEDPFCLVNADVFSDFKINASKTLLPDTLGHLILVPNPPHHPKGDFCLKEEFLSSDSEKSANTFSGVSYLSPDLFANCINDVFPLEPVLQKAARDGLLTGEIHRGIWVDVGAPERLKLAKSINLTQELL
jgi:MurNAc alpha-1-phosphate uridylyltransferase